MLYLWQIPWLLLCSLVLISNDLSKVKPDCHFLICQSNWCLQIINILGPNFKKPFMRSDSHLFLQLAHLFLPPFSLSVPANLLCIQVVSTHWFLCQIPQDSQALSWGNALSIHWTSDWMENFMSTHWSPWCSFSVLSWHASTPNYLLLWNGNNVTKSTQGLDICSDRI